MIDKSVPYFDITMVRPDGTPPAAVPDLPEGYQYTLYAPGDEQDWAAIETAVDEFDNEAQAQGYFARVFAPHGPLLSERMVFVRDPSGVAVADATAWWTDDPVRGRVALLHWVAVTPGAQGKGLGRAVSAKALSLFPSLGPAGDIWLHTQTWSHVAVSLYLQLGFRAHRSAVVGGEKNAYAGAISVLQTVMRPRDFALLTETSIP